MPPQQKATRAWGSGCYKRSGTGSEAAAGCRSLLGHLEKSSGFATRLWESRNRDPVAVAAAKPVKFCDVTFPRGAEGRINRL